MKHYLLVIFTFLYLQGCSQDPVNFEPVSFNSLKKWEVQNFSLAQQQFIKNCQKLTSKKGEHIHQNPIYGSVSEWKILCQQATFLKENQFKDFLENNFNVLEIRSQKESLFTGYYAPVIQGSLIRKEGFETPLYRKPSDLYTANLEDFFPELKGKKIIAVIDEKNRRFKPYYKRQIIDKMDLQAKPIVWLKSPVDAFFLHIQGSGYVELEDKSILHVAYAGSNGHSYHAIGRTLVQKGYMKKEDITMQSISNWLYQNPKKQKEIFNTNPRYIFFRKGNGQTTGSLNVPLEEKRSLAVDPHYIALGLPIFIETEQTLDKEPFNHIMYTEDTGAAIQGAVRGDIFFGKGIEAEQQAGAQNSKGNLYVFVPKNKI